MKNEPLGLDGELRGRGAREVGGGPAPLPRFGSERWGARIWVAHVAGAKTLTAKTLTVKILTALLVLALAALCAAPEVADAKARQRNFLYKNFYSGMPFDELPPARKSILKEVNKGFFAAGTERFVDETWDLLLQFKNNKLDTAGLGLPINNDIGSTMLFAKVLIELKAMGFATVMYQIKGVADSSPTSEAIYEAIIDGDMEAIAVDLAVVEKIMRDRNIAEHRQALAFYPEDARRARCTVSKGAMVLEFW